MFGDESKLSKTGPCREVISQSVNRPSVNQAANQSINEPVNQPASQSTNQTVSQSASHLISQPINQIANQSTSQSFLQVVCILAEALLTELAVPLWLPGPLWCPNRGTYPLACVGLS